MIIAIAVTTFSCKKSTKEPIYIEEPTLITCNEVDNYNVMVISDSNQFKVRIKYGYINNELNTYITDTIISPPKPTPISQYPKWDTLQYNFSQIRNEHFLFMYGTYINPLATYKIVHLIIKRNNELFLDTTFNNISLFVERQQMCKDSLIYYN